jgi:radical SAM-linked protein
MRLRIHFAKTEAMRYTGHLDLHRAWERTMRRAGLPLAYSQGFRPHPRINLGCALPLGFTSLDEVVDIWMEKLLPMDEIETALTNAIPPGIQIHALESIDEKEPTLQTQLLAAEYLITMLEAIPGLDSRLEEVCQSVSLLRQRRGKAYDLRPLILDLRRLADDENRQQRLLVVLSAREGATGRPEEVVLALGGDPTLTRVQRTRLIFADPLQVPSQTHT